MDPTKIQDARKAGYSDKEIADYLAAGDAKVQAARDAGYKDEEILNHLAPGPSFGRRALDFAGDVAGEVGDFVKRTGEYRDTQFAKAMGGVAGLPRATADAVKWGANQLGVGEYVPMVPFVGPAVTAGSMLPTGQEIGQSMLDLKKNAPVPPGGDKFTERNINPVVDAGVQALFSGPVLGVGGRLGPLASFGGGAGSEAAGEIAQKIAPQWEAPARVAGGVLGGATGVGLGMAATKMADVARAGVAPFTGEGRDAMVGSALNKVASDPQKAAAALESYQVGKEAFPDAVPGFRLDAGKASRDPGMMAAAETVPQGMRGPMVQENNRIITEALNRAQRGLPEPGLAGSIIQNELGQTVEGLKGVRAMETGPLYDAARKSPTPVKPFPLMTYTADAVAANKGEPAKVMQEARKLLFTTDKAGRTVADRSARGMMATRDAIGSMLEREGLDSYSRSLLMEMKSKVDDSLSAVPQAAAANKRFAELSRPLDPFNPDLGDLNRTMAKVVERNPYNTGYTMPAEKVPSQLMKGGDLSAPMVQKLMDASGGNPAVRDAMRSAYIADFRKAAASKVAEGAAGEPMLTAAGAEGWLAKHGAGATNVLTPDQIGALRDIARNLKDQAQVPPGRVGSPTFDRLATESIVGALVGQRFADAPFLHPIRRALGLVYGGANEATMNRLYEALQDPAVAKALMRKATPQNARLAEPVLRQITAGAAVPASKERQ